MTNLVCDKSTGHHRALKAILAGYIGGQGILNRVTW